MTHTCPKPPYCPQCVTMSASEAAQALSISRNTYYRRVKAVRVLLAECDQQPDVMVFEVHRDTIRTLRAAVTGESV